MDKPFENGCGHRKKVTIFFVILFVLTVIFVNSCETPENNVSRARQTSAYAVIDLRSGKIIKSGHCLSLIFSSLSGKKKRTVIPTGIIMCWK